MLRRFHFPAILISLACSGCSGGGSSSTGGSIAIVPAPSPTASASTAVVTLHTASVLASSHAAILGVNNYARFEGASNDLELESPLANIGVTGGRWPGVADEYDWQKSETCTSGPMIQDASGTFDAYMKTLEQPLAASVEITTNYGTGNIPDCDEPGDPALAAAWVNYSNNEQHYGIHWWEVGNEIWNPVEPDEHSPAHSPLTYIQNEPAFYTQMKAADSTINVGVPVTGSNWSSSWNTNVLAGAMYDYVIYHFYPERVGTENDATLLTSPQTILRSDLALIRAQLRNVGRSNVPISISEWNSVPVYPGKQTVSIVSALFGAETLGEMLNANITRAEEYSDVGCNQNEVNDSSTLYGWQNFGATALISPSVPDATDNLCPSANTTMAYGTPFPMGRIFQLVSQSGFVVDGQQVLGTSSTNPSVLAYAVVHGNNYELMLINTDENNTAAVPVAIDGQVAGGSYNWLRYGKADYDESQSGKWVGLESGNGSAWVGTLPAVLPPWSATVYTIPR